MKKLITSAFLFFTIFLANAASDMVTINSHASEIARRMATQIELNELEYIQVKKYTLEKLTRVEEIKDMYSNNLEMMTRKIQEEDVIYTNRIQNLLSAKQFEMYAALQNSFKVNLTMISESR